MRESTWRSPVVLPSGGTCLTVPNMQMVVETGKGLVQAEERFHLRDLQAGESRLLTILCTCLCRHLLFREPTLAAISLRTQIMSSKNSDLRLCLEVHVQRGPRWDKNAIMSRLS